jgi:hypothetical protein
LSGSPSSCTRASGPSSAWPRRRPTALPGQGGHRLGLARLLGHRAYVGAVGWGGVTYEVSHEPLVDRATFERVQELLAARAMRGTRERRHHHYLKGLLVCGVCGRRFSIQFTKGSYTYSYCLGQKDRRNGTGCGERYVAADQLEVEVEDLYSRIEMPGDWAEGLRQAIAAEIAARHEDTTVERYKPMEAYYADAIDVTMLRREGAHRCRATGHRVTPGRVRREASTTGRT